MIGSTKSVLAERGGIGRTPCFTQVALPQGIAPEITPGTLFPMTITGRDGGQLAGTRA
jgi:hypothetical protein